MEDVELVIKIPEKLYKHIMSMQLFIPGRCNGKTTLAIILAAIKNGTPLSKTIDSLKELSKDHRHNYVGNSCEERAWRLGIEDSIDVILADSGDKA